MSDLLVGSSFLFFNVSITTSAFMWSTREMSRTFEPFMAISRMRNFAPDAQVWYL
jgi:hypothetical protein